MEGEKGVQIMEGTYLKEAHLSIKWRQLLVRKRWGYEEMYRLLKAYIKSSFTRSRGASFKFKAIKVCRIRRL
jgi:hypothetical protein